MRSVRVGFLAAMLVCSLFCTRGVNAQDGNSDGAAAAPAIVTGQAFSAVKYTRVVRIGPNGKRMITREGHHVLLARDREGRIFMAGAGMAEEQCDLPSLGKLPLCDSWGPFLFDPKAGIMWHWTEGEFGDKTQLVRMDLQKDQIEDAERLTSVLDKKSDEGVAEPPWVTVQDLGEHNFEGILAKGLRTTTTHAGPDGKAAFIIHEVWTSANTRLVLRVVDGDPLGEETVSGLNHISLSPDSSLFIPPQGRVLRHPQNSSIYAVGDIDNLSEWFVK